MNRRTGHNQQTHYITRHFVISAVLIVALLIGIPLVTVYLLTQAFDYQIRSETNQASASISQTVRTFIDGAFDLSNELATNPGLKTTEAEKQTQILADTMSRIDYLELLYITGMDGMQTARSQGEPGDRSGRWWFVKAIECGRPFVSKSYYSISTDMPCTTVFIPMYDGNEMTGIFGADINLGYIQRLTERHTDPDRGRYSLIIDGEGVVIAHHDSEYLETLTNFKTMMRTVSATDDFGNVIHNPDGSVLTVEKAFAMAEGYEAVISSVMNGGSGLDIVEEDGATYYISYEPITLPGYSDSWSVITLQDKSVAMNVVYELVTRVLLIIVLILAVFVILILRFFKSLRKTLNSLENARDRNELQLTKLKMVLQATKIVLWDLEVEKGDTDPVGDSRSFMWSDEFRHFLGFTDENDFPNLVSSFTSRIHPEDRETNISMIKRHIMDKTGKTPFDVEVRLKKKSGEYAYYRTTGETIRDSEGNPVRVAGALMDISETRKLIEEIEEQRIEAENANKAKSAFLSKMSHEIRTPMNAILGITEIQLQNDSLDRDMRYAFNSIYASGDLLLSIINDILNLSKIEAGKMELVIDKYEIASLISDIVQYNIMRSGSKQIEFELSVDENTPLYLLGDELRIKQIMNNLLSNAFKYTAEGVVRLSVSAETREGDEVVLIICVSDTGQGMTEEQINELYDEYARFNMETNRMTEGTGLGMSITQNLIRLMDGVISVDSEPGKGTEFTVRLPQSRVGPEVLSKEVADNLREFRTDNNMHLKRLQIKREPMPYGSILIVDDVPTNIFVARGLMASYELKIDSADSGLAAIEKIKNGAVYDVIFMDHMMPKMDGVEAVGIIRNMGYDRPIIALTANAVSGQAEKYRESGFDDFISKPIDIFRLNTILNEFVRDRQPPEFIVAVRRQRADSETAGDVGETTGDEGGTAGDEGETTGDVGGTAGDVGETTGDEGGNDNGAGVVLSSSTGQLRCEGSSGANDEAVEQPDAHPRAEGENRANSGTVIRVLSKEMPGLDVTRGLKLFNNNEESYIRILHSYVSGARSMLGSIDANDINEDTVDDYRITVHGIKGASLAIFAGQISKEAEDLENAAKAGDLGYINRHNHEFIFTSRRFIGEIEACLLQVDAESTKPRKDKPDDEVLRRLLLACSSYDMDGVDAAINEIEQYQYESDSGLADWLRENVDMLSFEQIAEKLSLTLLPE